MKRGAVIAIIIVFAVIIISLVAYLIYRSSKKKSSQQLIDTQNQLAALQAQLNNPATPPQEKQNLISQIGNLAQVLQSSGININNLFTKNQGGVAGGGSSAGGGATSQPAGFPLKKGSNSPSVANLQKGLNSKCGAKLVADGKFGPLTESALSKCYNVTQADFALYNQIVS